MPTHNGSCADIDCDCGLVAAFARQQADSVNDVAHALALHAMAEMDRPTASPPKSRADVALIFWTTPQPPESFVLGLPSAISDLYTRCFRRAYSTIGELFPEWDVEEFMKAPA